MKRRKWNPEQKVLIILEGLRERESVVHKYTFFDTPHEVREHASHRIKRPLFDWH